MEGTLHPKERLLRIGHARKGPSTVRLLRHQHGGSRMVPFYDIKKGNHRP
jgi:hypothetical protein